MAQAAPTTRPLPSAGPQPGFLRGLALAFGLLALVLVPLSAAAAVGGEMSGIELMPQTRYQMHQMRDAWLQWSKSFEAGDGRHQEHLDRILVAGRALGFSRQPDLANAAAAYAVKAAKAGDPAKAAIALAAAESLDPQRPEISLAAAQVAWASGDVVGFLTSSLAGFRARLLLPSERTLILQNSLLWLLLTLAVSGALFIGLMMVAEGGALFYDIARLISPPVDRRAADFITLLILIWPIVLPSGFLWLILYWSVLLWAYATTNERIVLIFCWFLVGFVPWGIAQQQRAVQLAIAPPTRLLDNLENERLYGALFTDAEALRALLPDSPEVTEVMADIHRRLGQWDYARAIYSEITQDPEQDRLRTATAYNNVGVYYHRRKEYQTAITYFKRATEADSQLAHAFFNMGQSLAQLYDFNQSHAALGEAKALDSKSVEYWNQITQGVDPADAVIAIDGGLSHTGRIRSRLAEIFRGGDRQVSLFDLWRRHIAITVGVFALLLAMALGQARKQVGFRSTALDTTPILLESRISRTLVPGLDSANDDNGVLAFVALAAPVGCLALAFLCRYGYHTSVSFDSSCAIASITGWVAFALLMVLRFRSTR